MDLNLTNSYSFSVEKPKKKSIKNSSGQLPYLNNFQLSNTIATNHHVHIHRSSRKKTKSLYHSYYKTEPFLNSTFNKLRKDIYGNKIIKGGNHKISFIDNAKGEPLVETTLINLKTKIIKDKKKHKKTPKIETIIKESNDKEKIVCSSACNIF